MPVKLTHLLSLLLCSRLRWRIQGKQKDTGPPHRETPGADVSAPSVRGHPPRRHEHPFSMLKSPLFFFRATFLTCPYPPRRRVRHHHSIKPLHIFLGRPGNDAGCFSWNAAATRLSQPWSNTGARGPAFR